MTYKQILTPLNILLVFFAIVIGLIITLLWFLHQDVNIIKDQTYDILPGATSREIAYDLAQKEIIKHPLVFNLYVKLKNLDRELQAGRYEFTDKNKMTLKELIEFLASSARAREVQFTIPEGFTVEQVATLLEGKGLIKREAFTQALLEKVTSYKLQVTSLEGYLFPDTYRVYQDASPEEIINMMMGNFDKKVRSDLRQEIKRQGRTLPEAVIMASILEKEVKTEEDMRQVADILWRRLDADITLEVDSTLNYILADDDRRASLTFDQLKIDSPYNTYKYKGLPPSSICNPGLTAIRAAIYSEPNDYWFYLSASDGQTIFAKTYEEHLENKARWLK